MQKLTLQLKLVTPPDIANIGVWLKKAFGIVYEAKKACSYIGEVVYAILLLRKELLQAVSVPVFDVGEVLDIKQKDEHTFDVDIIVPIVDKISNELYNAATTFAMNIVLEYMRQEYSISLQKRLFEEIENRYIQKFHKVSNSGKSTLPILEVAHSLDIPFLHVGAGVYQLGWGANAKVMNRSSCNFDSAIGANLSENKYITSSIIRDAGLPAPFHGLASNYDEALKIALALTYPVVTKPVDQNRGEGISIDIYDEKALKEGFELALDASKSKQVIVEKQVAGVCYRIVVVGEKMLYAARRLAKSVCGDGIHNIKELINKANEQNDKLPSGKRSEVYPLDALSFQELQKRGYTQESIPKANEMITLRAIESTQWGGTIEDVTDIIHHENINIAIRAAKLFHLHIAGIDIISSDIGKPWYENGAIINEVNFSPLLGGSEVSKSKLPKFFDDFMKERGVIPIRVFIGDEKALEEAISYQKRQENKCFLTTDEKTYTNKFETRVYPFKSLTLRAKALLMDKDVEELVLVVQNDEILNHHLLCAGKCQINEVNENIVHFKNTQLKVDTQGYHKIIEALRDV